MKMIHSYKAHFSVKRRRRRRKEKLWSHVLCVCSLIYLCRYFSLTIRNRKDLVAGGNYEHPKITKRKRFRLILYCFPRVWTWPKYIRERDRETQRETDRQTDRQRHTQQERERGIRIRMIYSFRPLPLMKGCRWKTYHLTVHTIIIPILSLWYYA